MTKQTSNCKISSRILFLLVLFFSLRSNAIDDRQPLNILLVVSYFPKLSETFILNQVVGLLNLGHNVQVYAVKKELDIVHEDFITYDLKDRVVYHTDSAAKKSIFFNKTQFDVVLCHFGHRGYLGLELIQKYNIKAPLLTIFHGIDMSRNLDANLHVYDDLFPHLDLALPISDFWKKKLVSLGYDAKKIQVLRMGIDCDKFPFKSCTHIQGEPVRFITVARFIEKKGIAYSLRAFAQVAQERENIEYIIIGDGPLAKDFIDFIKVLGIKDKVRLMGSKTQKEVIEIFNTAHICVAPCVTGSDGDMEGIPVSLMEAMALGLPIISTWHSGIPELVKNGVTGFLVEERNVSQMAEKMRYMVDHKELWSGMGRAGRERIEDQFNAQKQMNRLVDIFYEYIDKKSHKEDRDEKNSIVDYIKFFLSVFW